MLVEARLPVVLPSWYLTACLAHLFPPPSSLPPTTQLFICSAADVLSLTLQPQRTALPLCH